jgi:hypothetical protein
MVNNVGSRGFSCLATWHESLNVLSGIGDAGLLCGMPLTASVATKWGWNLAGIKEWFGLRVAASDVQLWECTTFLWMTKPIFSFRAQLPLWLGGSVDLHNCHLRRCRISCAVVMCTGWHCLCTVHEDCGCSSCNCCQATT